MGKTTQLELGCRRTDGLQRGLQPTVLKPRWRGWRKASDPHRHSARSGAALTSGIGLVGLSVCWLGRKPRGDFKGRYSSNSEPAEPRRNPSSAKVSGFPAESFVLRPVITQMQWQRAHGAAETHSVPTEGERTSGWHQEEGRD